MGPGWLSSMGPGSLLLVHRLVSHFIPDAVEDIARMVHDYDRCNRVHTLTHRIRTLIHNSADDLPFNANFSTRRLQMLTRQLHHIGGLDDALRQTVLQAHKFKLGLRFTRITMTHI